MKDAEEQGMSFFPISVFGKGVSEKRFTIPLDDVWGECTKLMLELGSF